MSEAHLKLVRSLPCHVCGFNSTAHHIQGGSALARLGTRGNQKHSDYLAIALCHNHHQGHDGIHRLGAKTWERIYGTQVSMVDRQCEQLGLNLWLLATQERDKKRLDRTYVRPSKIIPRAA